MAPLKFFRSAVSAIGERLFALLTLLMVRTGALACFNLPDGALIHFGSTVGVAKTMSAVSNAAEGVATLEASHGFVENDIGIIVSGWPKLNGRIARIDSVSTNDVVLEDINTSNTTRYPAGAGIGTLQEVTAWTEIPYISEAQSQGGEQQFTTVEFLGSDDQYELPTSRTPRRMTLQVADEPTLAHFPLLVALDEARTATAVRITLPSGSLIYFLAIISFNKIPSLTKGQLMANACSLALRAEPTRY